MARCFNLSPSPFPFTLFSFLSYARLRLRPAGHAYAGDGVAGRDLAQVRVYLRALGDGLGAARVEAAAPRRVDRRRHVAFEHDALAPARRVGDGDGREERARVGVERAGVQLLGGGDLDDAAQDRKSTRLNSSHAAFSRLP